MFLVVGSACTGSDERTGALIVRRDSLGISIVESAGPSEEWSVSGSPILDLGFDDRERYVFSSIQDIGRLSNGDLVVLDNAPPFVRVFDSHGAFVRSFGESGDGPGEFRGPRSLSMLPGDNILIDDLNGSRLTTLSSALEFQSAHRVEGAAAGSSSLTQIGDTVFVANDGISSRDWTDLPRGISRPVRPFELVGASGTALGVIAEIAIGDVMVSENSLGAPPFGRFTQIAGFDGKLIVGFGLAPEVEWRNERGDVIQLARLELNQDLSISATDISELIELRVAAWGGRGGISAESIRSALDDQPMVESKGAYSLLIVDRVGFVWLGEYVVDPRLVTPKRWHVLGPDGAWKATIDLPDRFTPFWIDRETIIGVARIEWDVETVQAYELYREQ